jgi:hypothetical protein
VSGLQNWWDAGTAPASLSFTSLVDKKGSVQLTFSSTTTWYPRLSVNGLGGCGAKNDTPSGLGIGNWATTLHPILLASLYTSATSLTFGTNGAGTIAFVWTRPNQKQQAIGPTTGGVHFMTGFLLGGNCPLAQVGVTPLLSMSSTGTGGASLDTLTIFPSSGTPTVLSTTIEYRHTHSIVIAGSHTAGWDVYLDGTKLNGSPIASQFPSAPTTAVLNLLGNSTANGSAQCWFHEAFFYNKILNSGELATVESYLTRWTRGIRYGASVIAVGQSNCDNMRANTNNFRSHCTGVEYLTGLASFTIICQSSGNDGVTPRGGQGLISNLPASTGYYVNGLLASSPATWNMGTGALGNGGSSPSWVIQQLIGTMGQQLQEDVKGFYAPFSENDTGYGTTYISQFATAIETFSDWFRGWFTLTTKIVPSWLIEWGDIPYGSMGSGAAASEGGHRTSVQTVINSSGSYNAHWMLGNGYVVNTNASTSFPGTYNPVTGIFTGGDSQHVDYTIDDPANVMFTMSTIAHRLNSIGVGSTIPAGFPVNGGPVVTNIVWEYGTISGNPATPTCLVTVVHDAGNDLVLTLPPAQAGLGWIIIDGGVLASSPQIQGTNCVRVDATHLRVTWGSAPVHAIGSGTVWLYYCLGATINYLGGASNTNNAGRLGRNCAITDNYSSMPAVPGYDIAADLGASFKVNQPLNLTPVAIVV